MAKTALAWKTWEKATFELARERRQPLFLWVAPFWVAGGPEGSRAHVEEGTLGELIGTRFVPVAVDPETTPQVATGCDLGDFPEALVIDCDGSPLARFPHPDAHNLKGALAGIAAGAFHSEAGGRRGMGRFLVPAVPPSDGDLERGLEALEVIRTRVRVAVAADAFERHSSQTRIESLRFLIKYSTCTGEREDMDRAIEHLHFLAHSTFYDAVEGGFFGEVRPAGTSTHKLLRHNAEWLMLALRICRLPEAPFAMCLARGILHFLQLRLQLPSGGFASSLREDASYYALSGEDRRKIAAPPADQSIYTAPNALVLRALCKGWRLLGEPVYLEQALATFRFLETSVEAPGGALAHAFDGAPSGTGTLDDAVEIGQTYLALYHSTLEPQYLDGVLRAADRILGSFRNPGGEAFLDMPPGAAAAGLPFRPTADPGQNARACTFLLLASAQLGEERFVAPARRTLGALLASPPTDLESLSLLGDALLVALYPLAVYEAITDGSQDQRFRVLERLRQLGTFYAVVTDRRPAPKEGMQRLPRLVSCCGNQRCEVPV